MEKYLKTTNTRIHLVYNFKIIENFLLSLYASSLNNQKQTSF